MFFFVVGNGLHSAENNRTIIDCSFFLIFLILLYLGFRLVRVKSEAVAGVSQPSSQPSTSGTVPYAHYIIEKGTLNVVVERERLESSLNSSEVRFLLDLSEENVKELLHSGRTTVRNLLGGKKETVTMKGCNCQNMTSHQRGGAAQFQM